MKTNIEQLDIDLYSKTEYPPKKPLEWGKCVWRIKQRLAEEGYEPLADWHCFKKWYRPIYGLVIGDPMVPRNQWDNPEAVEATIRDILVKARSLDRRYRLYDIVLMSSPEQVQVCVHFYAVTYMRRRDDLDKRITELENQRSSRDAKLLSDAD